MAVLLGFVGLVCYAVALTKALQAARPAPVVRVHWVQPGWVTTIAKREAARAPRATGPVATAPPAPSRQVQALTCPKCGGAIGEESRKCPYCGATLIVTSPVARATPTLLHLGWLRLGDQVMVAHPSHGLVAAQVLGRIVYEELWQRSRGGPWEPTGNAFGGFWLDRGWCLLNTLERYYLLDERRRSQDSEIGMRFTPYARRFGQSDQTAVVCFEYPPQSGTQWQIEDIGKLRVQSVEGTGFEMRPGATLRFLHARSTGNRALIVEDYETGLGGQDMIRQGYAIAESAVRQSTAPPDAG